MQRVPSRPVPRIFEGALTCRVRRWRSRRGPGGIVHAQRPRRRHGLLQLVLACSTIPLCGLVRGRRERRRCLSPSRRRRVGAWSGLGRRRLSSRPRAPSTTSRAPISVAAIIYQSSPSWPKADLKAPRRHNARRYWVVAALRFEAGGSGSAGGASLRHKRLKRQKPSLVAAPRPVGRSSPAKTPPCRVRQVARRLVCGRRERENELQLGAAGAAAERVQFRVGHAVSAQRRTRHISAPSKILGTGRISTRLVTATVAPSPFAQLSLNSVRDLASHRTRLGTGRGTKFRTAR